MATIPEVLTALDKIKTMDNAAYVDELRLMLLDLDATDTIYTYNKEFGLMVRKGNPDLNNEADKIFIYTHHYDGKLISLLCFNKDQAKKLINKISEMLK